MSHTAPSEKKHGFSKLFGGSKKHESTTPSSSSQPLTQSQIQPDSEDTTENPTSNPNSSNNVETRQEVAPNPENITKEDIERDNDLQVQPKQNEDGSHNVMNRRTGAVVTTVTTTTTTTTTTTHGPGRPAETKKEVVTERTEPRSLQQPTVHKEESPPNLTRDSGIGSEFQNESNRSSNVSSEAGIPSLPAGAYAPTSATGFTNSNEPTINTNDYQSQQGYPQRVQDSPPVPERSIARDQNMAPISPLNANQKHNFSYPSRTVPPPTQNTMHGEKNSPIGTGPHAGAMELPAGGEMTPGLDRQTQLGASTTADRIPTDNLHDGTSPVSPIHSTAGNNQAAPFQRQSTLSSLKAAAAGIHGVGETLRGTLSSNIDRRIPGSRSAEEQAALVQKHDDIAAAGRSEMETQRFHDSVREREKARGVGKVISRKPLSQQDQPGGGGLRVMNQDPPINEDGSTPRSTSKSRKFF